MGRWTVVVALARPFTLLAPTLGVLTASAVACLALDRPYEAVGVGLAVLAAAAATVASNAWNQVFDVQADRVNKPRRPVASGALSRAAALRVGHAAAILALVLGAFVRGEFLACVAIGLLATWAYSAPPLRWKRRPVAALLCIALPRGLLVPVAGWSVIAVPDRSDPWALGGVAFGFVLGAAATKDFSDVEGDRADECRTLPILWGPRRAARFVAPFLVLPFLCYPLFGGLGWIDAPLGALVALAFALAGLGIVTARALLRDPEGASVAGTGHPAWRGMYLLLLGSQVGVLIAYAV